MVSQNIKYLYLGSKGSCVAYGRESIGRAEEKEREVTIILANRRRP
jgi:hypothetical protein